MKPKNGMILITTIDNTKDQGVLDLGYVKGYSDMDRLTIPNEGYDADGNRLWYFNYNVIMVEKDKAMIHVDDIFMINDDLTKEGLVVHSNPFKQVINSIDARTQNFYQVELSTMDSVDEGNVIIIRPAMYYWFVKDGERYSFIHPNAVMLNISEKILPGPDYCLLDEMETSGVLKQTYLDRGRDILDEKVKYFTVDTFRVTIKGKQYWVCQNDDVYGEDDHG